MESFVWEPCFVTGLAAVDEQHHRLVDLINRFGEMLMQPAGACASDVVRVFDELAGYAARHFSEEEALMAQARLDPRHRELHGREHAGFLLEIGAMRARLSGTGGVEAHLLLHFLTDWLAYHILGVDQSMSRQKAAIEAGATPQDAYRLVQQQRDPATAALLQSLDRLFRHVTMRNRALIELNATLEARVAKRTRELVEANARLEDIALTDALTGLANRRRAMRVLQQEWDDARRLGKPLACIMVDADGFKCINDAHGHEAGDAVLRELALCLDRNVRSDDTACRLGGDEFLVICPSTPPAGVRQLAETLRERVHRLRVPAGSGVWHGSISAGCAVLDASMACKEDLLRAADLGLYAAKRAGRDCVCCACGSDLSVSA